MMSTENEKETGGASDKSDRETEMLAKEIAPFARYTAPIMLAVLGSIGVAMPAAHASLPL